MKIGMILDAPFPIDPRVSNEASALISAGHEVYLFCLSYSKKFIKKDKKNKIFFTKIKNKSYFNLRNYIHFQLKTLNIKKIDIINKYLLQKTCP